MPTDGFQPVIFIAGGTGVGTSTLARALVPVVRATGVVGTDSLREALREMKALGRLTFGTDYPATVLDSSTYDAWTTEASAPQHEYQREAAKARIARMFGARTTWPEDTQGTDALILRCANQQTQAVMDAAIGVARRAIREGFSLIIEGVHVDLQRLMREEDWHLLPTESWDRIKRRLFPILLVCEDERHHFERLQERDQKHRYRPKKASYGRYWHALRTISEHLTLHEEYALVTGDTQAPLDELVEKTARAFYAFKTSRGHDQPRATIEPPKEREELRRIMREHGLEEPDDDIDS